MYYTIVHDHGIFLGECSSKSSGGYFSDRCVYSTPSEIWVDCAKTCKAQGAQIATYAVFNNLALASQVASFYDERHWVGGSKPYLEWTRCKFLIFLFSVLLGH